MGIKFSVQKDSAPVQKKLNKTKIRRLVGPLLGFYSSIGQRAEKGRRRGGGSSRRKEAKATLLSSKRCLTENPNPLPFPPLPFGPSGSSGERVRMGRLEGIGCPKEEEERAALGQAMH